MTNVKTTPPGGYEFRDDQNTAISAMAGAMRLGGILWLLYGLVSGGISLVTSMSRPGAGGAVVGGVIGLILNTMMGVWTLSAASSFDKVVSTTGSDIQNTMAALVNLRRFFATLRVLIVVLLVVGLLAVAKYMSR
ncbi:MAG: hypothetical protein WCJ30_22580 [Deltaproteobacteria bacterium]